MLHVWYSGMTPSSPASEADNHNFSRLSGRIGKDPSSAGKPRTAAIGRFGHHVAKNLTPKKATRRGTAFQYTCIFESSGARLFLVSNFCYIYIKLYLGDRLRFCLLYMCDSRCLQRDTRADPGPVHPPPPN